MFGNSGGLAISTSPKETLDLLEYYRNDMDAYKEVRKNAVTSVQNHTYKERAEEIVQKMFGKS